MIEDTLNDAALTESEMKAVLAPFYKGGLSFGANTEEALEGVAQAQLRKALWWVIAQIREQQQLVDYPLSVAGAALYVDRGKLARRFESAAETWGIEPWPQLEAAP